MSGGPVYVPSQRQDPHGDADAMRAYARKLRSMATRLETISNASDSTVYFYSYDWKGAARDNFLTLWNSSMTATDCLSSTARGTLYRQYQADRRDAIREHPETARMWNAERYEGPGKTAFRVAIDACNDLARYLDDFAHVIDEEHAQDDKFALDVVIIVVSVVATVATLGALGPEMALLDVALLGAAIGGATAGAINFTNQMVDNMEVGHQGFVEAFMGVDTDELGKAIITGEIVGAVSTFAGAGLGQVFSGAPAAGRIAISALGFGGGTFVGDAGAQALLNDGHRVDWSQAAVDGLTATAFAGAFGTVLHVAGGATPAGKPTMTVRNAGDEFEVTFQSDTSMPVMRNGQPIGNARFETVELDGVTHTSLVIDEGGVRIPLQGKNVMLSNGVAHVEVTVGPEGPQAISTRLISDGSLIVQPAPGERGMPAAMVDEGGGVTVPKDWAVTRFSDGTVTLDPRSPNANTITFRTSGTSAELVIKTPDLESSLGVVRGGDGASLLGEGAPELPRTGSDISPFVKGGDGAFLDTALRTDAGEGLVTTADGQRFANLKLPETPGAGFEAPETAAASAAGDGAIGDLGPGLPESGGAGAIGDVRPVLPESGGGGALEVPRGVATEAGPFNPTPVQPASGPVPQTQVGTRGVDLQVLDRPTTDAGAGEDVLPPGERLTDLTLDDMLNGRWDAPEGPVSENLLTTPDLVVPPSVSTATPIEPGVVSPAMPVPPVAPTPPPVVPPRAVAPAVFNAGLSALPRPPAPFTPVSSLTVPSTLPLEMPAPSPVPEISPVQPLTVPRPVTGTQIIPPATFVPRPVPLTVPPLGAPMPAGPMPAPATPMPLPVAPNPLPAGPTTPVGPTPLPVRPAPLPVRPAPLPAEPTPLPTGPTPEPTGPTTTPGPGSSPRPAPGPTPLPTTPGTAPQPAPVPGRPAMPVPGIPPSVTPVPGLLPPAGPVEPPPVEVPLVRPVELPPPPAAPEVTQPRILSWTPEIPVEVPDRPAGALVDPTPIKPRPASPAWVPDIQASAAAGAPEPRIHVVEGLVLPEDAARPETAAAQVPLRIAMLPTLGMPLPPVHYGGNARVINDLTNELVRRGHAVTLFAAENSVTPAQLHPVVPRAFTEMDMAAENPRTVLMGDPWEIGRNRYYRRQIIEAQKRVDQFDVIHIHLYTQWLLEGARLPAPVLMTLHNELDTPEARAILRQFPGINLVSISNDQRLPVADLDLRWTQTVYHGLELESRYQLGRGDGGYLAFLGRLAPDKDPVRAIEIARRAGIPLRLIGGVGPRDRRYFEEHVQPLLDHPLIHWEGEQDDQGKNEILGGASALIAPTAFREPFGLVYIEAGAVGTPVVSRPIGSLPEIIVPGMNGFLTDDTDQMVEDVQAAADLDREAIRRHTLDNYSVERMADGYEAVYRNLRDGGPAPQTPAFPPPRPQPPSGSAAAPSAPRDATASPGQLEVRERPAAPVTPEPEAEAGAPAAGSPLSIAMMAPLGIPIPPTLYGGAGRVVAELTDELVRRGHDVTLLGPANAATTARLLGVSPRPVTEMGLAEQFAHTVLMGSRFDAAAGRYWRLQLLEIEKRSRDFDVVHAHSYWHWLVAPRLDVPMVGTLHNVLTSPAARGILQRFRDLPVVSISDAQREPVANLHLNWAGTVHNGLDLRSRYELGTGDGGYVAFLGRLSPDKDPLTAIDVAIRAGIPLKIAGRVGGADAEFFENQVRPRLRHPLVEWVGEQDDSGKNELLGGARALVAPTTFREPFGLVYIESLATGTPVVARPRGSLPEIVVPGLDGFLSEDVDEMVAAVEAAANLDRAGIRQRALDRFSVQRMADGYEAVYRGLVVPKGSSPAQAPPEPDIARAPQTAGSEAPPAAAPEAPPASFRVEATPPLLRSNPYDPEPSSSYGLAQLREQYAREAEHALRALQAQERERLRADQREELGRAPAPERERLRLEHAGAWQRLIAEQEREWAAWAERPTTEEAELRAALRAMEHTPVEAELVSAILDMRQVDAFGNELEDGRIVLRPHYDVVIHPAGATRPPMTEVQVRVALVAEPGVSDTDLARVAREAQQQVDHFFNAPHHRLADGAELHVDVRFVSGVTPPNYKQVRVLPGAGRASETKWYVETGLRTHAHELGHMLGLADEYFDHERKTRGRERMDDAGVHYDGSLMGEQVDLPMELKPRHLERIARVIERARQALAAEELTGGLIRHRFDLWSPGVQTMLTAERLLREQLDAIDRMLGEERRPVHELVRAEQRLTRTADDLTGWLERFQPAPDPNVARAREAVEQASSLQQRLRDREGEQRLREMRATIADWRTAAAGAGQAALGPAIAELEQAIAELRAAQRRWLSRQVPKAGAELQRVTATAAEADEEARWRANELHAIQRELNEQLTDFRRRIGELPADAGLAGALRDALASTRPAELEQLRAAVREPLAAANGLLRELGLARPSADPLRVAPAVIGGRVEVDAQGLRTTPQTWWAEAPPERGERVVEAEVARRIGAAGEPERVPISVPAVTEAGERINAAAATATPSTSEDEFAAAAAHRLDAVRASVRGPEGEALARVEDQALRMQWRFEETRRVTDPLAGTATQAARRQVPRELGAEVIDAATRIVDAFNDPTLSSDARRARIRADIEAVRERVAGTPLADAIDFEAIEAAVAALRGTTSAGLVLMDGAGQVTVNGQPAGSLRGLLEDVVTANRANHVNGIDVEYVVNLDAPSVNGRSEVQVIARPRTFSLPPEGVPAQKLAELPDDVAGRYVVEIGAGSGSFAVDMVPATEQEATILVQTELGEFAFRAQMRRDQQFGLRNVAPRRGPNSVVVLGDALRRMELFFGRPDAGAGVRRVIINNINAHYTREQYDALARELRAALADDGQVEVQWDDSPEDARGNPRGHIEGEALRDALLRAGVDVDYRAEQGIPYPYDVTPPGGERPGREVPPPPDPTAPTGGRGVIRRRGAQRR